MSVTLCASASKASASKASASKAMCVQAGEAKLSMSLPRALQFEEYMECVLETMPDHATASWVASLGLGASPEEKARFVLQFCKYAHKFQAKRAKKAKADMSELSDDSVKIATARRLEAARALQALVPELTAFKRSKSTTA
jgi:hypothetical protein